MGIQMGTIRAALPSAHGCYIINSLISNQRLESSKAVRCCPDLRQLEVS